MRQLLRLPVMRRTGPVAGHVELEYDRVMHDPVYRCGRRHRIGEHLLPLREDEVGGDAQRAAFVALRYQDETAPRTRLLPAACSPGRL